MTSASLTSLSVTSGGAAVTNVPSGAVVSLTASVTASGSPVNAGQVNFCDATASDCIGIHLLAAAQLNSGGHAIYRFRPASGSRLYKAVFVGTNTVLGSTSGQSSLSVSAAVPPSVLSTTTTMTRNGSWGSYAVSATVTEIGSAIAPAGAVSFIDTTGGNGFLASVALGPETLGTSWLTSRVPTPGNGPRAIIPGDFNEDGIVDLAVTESSSGSITILLGSSDGTFTPAAVSPSTGVGPLSIFIADFNQDGHQDLATQNVGDGTVTILLGNGDGTFNATPRWTVYQSYTKMMAGDFNGDGKVDLVCATDTSLLTIFLGNGDGTFSAGPTLTLATPALAVVPADFNGDGKTDLAVGDSSKLTLLLGNGDGTFVASGVKSLPGAAYSMIAADFNGDGKLDLAVSGNSTAQGANGPLSVFLGNGDGTLNAATTNPSIPSPNLMVLTDLNQDGIADIIVPSSMGLSASVLFGRGDGTFTTAPIAAPATNLPTGIAVADFDGDGVPDLALTNVADSSVSIDITEPTVTITIPSVTLSPGAPGAHLVQATYPGTTLYRPSASSIFSLWGQPPVTAAALTITAGGTAVTSVAPNTVVTLTATVTTGGSPVPMGQVNFCDATAPSCTDIHLIGSAQLTSAGTAALRIIPGSGSHQYKAVFLESALGQPSFSPIATLIVQPAVIPPAVTTTAIFQSGPVANYTLTATVTSKGRTEPMSGTVSFQDTSVSNAVVATAQLSVGTAGIGWVPSFSATYVNPGFLHFAGGDFNGDGIPDFIAISSNEMIVAVHLGHGDGSFTTATAATLSTYTTGVITADFNGDGILDFAVSSVSGTFPPLGSLAIYLGKGDGTFTAATTAPTVGGSAQVFGAADINGDGKLDLVVNEGLGTRILYGNGDGTFSQGPNGLPTTVAVADLNGDGIPDMVTGTNNAQASVYLGNGDGTFYPAPAALPVSTFAAVVSVADFNGDGVPDLVVNSQFNVGGVLLGKGDGTFTQVSNSFPRNSNEPLSTVVGDFNHDGKLDVLISNYNASSNNTINPDLILLLGNGDGTFTVGAIDTQFNGTAEMLVEDVDGDGTSDVILNAQNLTVLLTKPTQTATATATGIALLGPGTHAVDAVYQGDNNYLTSTSATTPLYSQVAAPTFSIAAGTYTSTQTVTLADSTSGATIFYTLFGPGVSTNLAQYKGPLTLAFGGTYTLQAYATASGYQQSPTPVATYTLNLTALPALTFTPVPAAYSTAQTVSITDAVPGTVIYYTVNGQFPTTSSAVYSSPIPVSASQTIIALAMAPGYTGASSLSRYVITRAPAITWSAPAAITYGTPLSVTQLNATAAVPGTFAYSPAAGAILDAGNQILSVTFTPTNTQIYPVATANVTLTVNSATPVINWPSPAPIGYGTALSIAQLNASTTVPGTFVYSPPAGTVLNPGTQTLSVTFTPSNSTDFTPASSTTTIAVSKAVPQITWPTPAALVYGTALTSTQLNATASVPGTFTYLPAIGTVLPAGTSILTVAFTPADTASYVNTTSTSSIVVSKAVPQLTWATPASITYGAALSSTQLNATASVPGTFTYLPAVGSVVAAGTNTLTVSFTPTDTANYAGTTSTTTIAVSKAVPQLTWAAPASITYGTALSPTQLNATASVPGTFTYSPAIGGVLPAGTSTLTVAFTPTDTASYVNTTSTSSITVSKAIPQLTWATPASITYGTALSSTQLNATASVPGAFTYSPATGSVLPAGNQTLSATFTPTDVTDYGTATASVVLSVVNPVPVIAALVPAHTVAGGAAFSITVNGAGFVPTSTVLWAGSPLATQYVSATQLTVSVPASAIATAATASVTVQTGAPGGGSSGTLQFQIDSPSNLGAATPTFTALTATVAPGATASYPVNLSSSVISTVVTCLNLPAGATCSYANGVLSIATSANTPRGTYAFTVVFTETLAGAAGGFLLPLLLLPWRNSRKRRRLTGAKIMALAALSLVAGGYLLAGCAGGTTSGGGPTNPVTHQATSSSTVTLILQ